MYISIIDKKISQKKNLNASQPRYKQILLSTLRHEPGPANITYFEITVDTNSDKNGLPGSSLVGQ